MTAGATATVGATATAGVGAVVGSKISFRIASGCLKSILVDAAGEDVFCDMLLAATVNDAAGEEDIKLVESDEGGCIIIDGDDDNDIEEFDC